MALLPYCIFLPQGNPIPTTGIEDRPIHSLETAGLSAIYSELEPAQISGDQFRGAALRFHDVVHTVFGRQAVVPFRFPTFLSEGELREHLRQESARYMNFLGEHVDDVQMEVRLWRASGVQPQGGTGTEYMQRLLEETSVLKAAGDHLRQISQDIVREWKSVDSRDATRLFVLIARSRIDDFRERLHDQSPRSNIEMRVTGPWPAMEFFAAPASPMPHNVLSSTRGETS